MNAYQSHKLVECPFFISASFDNRQQDRNQVENACIQFLFLCGKPAMKNNIIT
jgi:hypothetical protein